MAETVEWSKGRYDLEPYLQPFRDLEQRLLSGSGQDAALVGKNGVGKSMLINLMLHNTSIDEVTYRTMDEVTCSEYVPEAVRDLFSGCKEGVELPSFRMLLANPGTVHHST